jgi:hypothetical protein
MAAGAASPSFMAGGDRCFPEKPVTVRPSRQPSFNRADDMLRALSGKSAAAAGKGLILAADRRSPRTVNRPLTVPMACSPRCPRCPAGAIRGSRRVSRQSRQLTAGSPAGPLAPPLIPGLSCSTGQRGDTERRGPMGRVWLTNSLLPSVVAALLVGCADKRAGRMNSLCRSAPCPAGTPLSASRNK